MLLGPANNWDFFRFYKLAHSLHNLYRVKAQRMQIQENFSLHLCDFIGFLQQAISSR